MQQQLPIKTTIRFSKPTPSFWHNFSQSYLWQHYLRLRLALDDCCGSVIHGKRSIVPYHIRAKLGLDFHDFINERKCHTLAQMQQQLPIKTTIRFSKFFAVLLVAALFTITFST